ncbi:hypothetical protein [uncultured Erythrobacter sp.]|uniref:hypothetical protein n=1 Tax=uncultured Erythrobacter sp. TaxID=263913 RepID=UPI00262AE84F|nr:hypothetical protein [uncultured Erythrobacter sp.]
MKRPGSQKVIENFKEVSSEPSGVLIRPARRKVKSKPFSIRLSDAERAQLEREAGSKPLAVYMRSKLLSNDKPTLARLLAALGASDLARSMRDVAASARNGAFEETPEMLLTLESACAAIEDMRTTLLRALGLRPRD